MAGLKISGFCIGQTGSIVTAAQAIITFAFFWIRDKYTARSEVATLAHSALQSWVHVLRPTVLGKCVLKQCSRNQPFYPIVVCASIAGLACRSDQFVVSLYLKYGRADLVIAVDIEPDQRIKTCVIQKFHILPITYFPTASTSWAHHLMSILYSYFAELSVPFLGAFAADSS